MTPLEESDTPSTPAPEPPRRRRRDADAAMPGRERSALALGWYRVVQGASRLSLTLMGGVALSGRSNLPERGGALLISNHQSFWDVFVLGGMVPRPLNFVARSTLFTPVVGPLIRSVGGFPIQREGFGAQGFKETLRRLRAGGIVTFFPEGTRSPDGELQELKPGIATLATRSRAPLIPSGIAGTFESWPRGQKLPRRHRTHLHLGPPIAAEELDGLTPDEATALIRDRLLSCVQTAREHMTAGRPGASESRSG